MHTPLIAEDTRLHIIEVILTALLERRVVALLLELLCLQIVTGVILITDSQRHDVQVTEFIHHITFSTHRQHLQYRLLRTIVRVFRPTLTLCYPYILLLLGDGIMDVTTHQLTTTHHLMGCQPSAHGECFIHAHQSFNPRIDEQVIPDTDFYCCRITFLIQHHIKEG